MRGSGRSTRFVGRPKTLGTVIQTAVLAQRIVVEQVLERVEIISLPSHLRQAGLSEAVDKMVSYRCIAQRLGAEPMADREMRVGDQEQFCFSPCLLAVAQLRKRSRQELA